MYKVVKGLKYYRVNGTDIEDRDLELLAKQMADDLEIVNAYHMGEIDMSNLRPEKQEQLEYFLRKYIVGEEIKEGLFSGDEEFFPTIPIDQDFLLGDLH